MTMMETISESEDDYSESAASPSHSSEDDISEASSALFIDLEGGTSSISQKTNLLPEMDDEDETELMDDSNDDLFSSTDEKDEIEEIEVDVLKFDISSPVSEIEEPGEDATPVVKNMKEEKMDHGVDPNSVTPRTKITKSISKKPTKTYDLSGGSSSKMSLTSEKKYDLGGGSAEKNKKYDLSGGGPNSGSTPTTSASSSPSEKKYDLSTPTSSGSGSPSTKKYDLSNPTTLSPASERKYDLSSYLSTSFESGSRRSITDESRTTEHRSGSTSLILHKWLNDKDWDSARMWFTNPERNQKRLLQSVHDKNDDGETALHIACRRHAPLEIVKAIIKVSGPESVMAVDSFGGQLPLHHACHFNAHFDVIQFLVYTGGEQSVKIRDSIDNIPLHWALSKNAPSEAVKLLIDIGGRDTLNMTNRLGWNALHAATFFRSKYSVIKLLTDIGGTEIVNSTNRKNKTPLDILYDKNPYDTDSIQLVQDKMGEDERLMTWLPRETSLSTLDWVKRQSGRVQKHAFQSPYLQMILNDTLVDNQFLAILVIDLLAQILLVVTLSYGLTTSESTGYHTAPFWAINLLMYGTFWLSARMIMGMVAIPVGSWVGEFSNWLAGAQNVLAIWTIVILGGNGDDQGYKAAILVSTIGIVWFRLVFVIGTLFYGIAVFAFALQRIAIKLVAFLVSSTLVILGFAHMIHTASTWDNRNCLGVDAPECEMPTLGNSFYIAFTEFLIPGNIFSDEPYLRTNRFHLVITFIFAILIELVLLNVLIAEIVHSLDLAKERGKRSFWEKRFNFIMELGNIYKSPCTRRLAEVHEARWGNNDRQRLKSEKKMPTTRFTFSTAHYEIFPGDFYSFCKWWTKDGDVPSLFDRITYFFTWASIEEIILPSNTFERILSGKGKDDNSYLCRLGLYFIFPFMIVAHFLFFLGGLLSFGFLWPKWMRIFLFSGSIEGRRSHSHPCGEQIDVIRNEVKSISNEFKAEKFVVKNLENDIMEFHDDLKRIGHIMTRSESAFIEDEMSEMYSAQSDEA